MSSINVTDWSKYPALPSNHEELTLAQLQSVKSIKNTVIESTNIIEPHNDRTDVTVAWFKVDETNNESYDLVFLKNQDVTTPTKTILFRPAFANGLVYRTVSFGEFTELLIWIWTVRSGWNLHWSRNTITATLAYPEDQIDRRYRHGRSCLG